MYQYLYIQCQETFTTYKTCERVNKWGPGATAQLANPPPLSARIHVSSDSCPGHCLPSGFLLMSWESIGGRLKA